MLASVNASMVDGKSGGRSKPSVSSDEPLVSNALRQPCSSRPTNMKAYARKISNSDVAGSVSNASGAYIDMRRSRRSYPCDGRANKPNTLRTPTNTTAVKVTKLPRGTTNVRTAASRPKNVIPRPIRNRAMCAALVMSVVARRRLAAGAFDLAVMTLGFDAAALRGARRRGRDAFRIDVQAVGELRTQALDGEL